MNPQSATIAGSGNPLKSRFEYEIRAKIFSKSADPFAYYTTPSKKLRKLCCALCKTLIADDNHTAGYRSNLQFIDS